MKRTYWPPELIFEALQLASEGRGDRAISAATGIPTATLRTYRRRPPERVARLLNGDPACAGCDGEPHAFSVLPADEYSYLLGMYLGDGCLSQKRTHYQLRLALDQRYPGVIAAARRAVHAVRGEEPSLIASSNGSRCIYVSSGWRSWACLLPQHGPGPKHERTIALVDWQRGLVDTAPESFMRGLVHSDGCRTTNRFKTKLPSGRVAEYAYPRYFFSNLSQDILGLFTETCDALGIRWTRSNHRNISVSHRASVARMDEFIGPKV